MAMYTEKTVRRVLLADDEERYVRQLGRLLEARGFEADTTTDGRQALERMKSRHFDAVVLDLRMPVMDGMTALARIQDLEAPPPVIMLTGHATLETGIEAIRRGAFDYLIKPCDIEDLTAKLDLACKAGQIRQQPVLWPRSTAGELVLDAFRRIVDTDPLLEAVSIFNHRLPRMAGETLYIVNADGQLCGHLGKSDVIDRAAGPGTRRVTWAELSTHPQWLPDIETAAAMHPETVAVTPDTPLDQTARIMIERGFQTLPVIDDRRRVLGVIRLKDVLVYIGGSLENGRQRSKG